MYCIAKGIYHSSGRSEIPVLIFFGGLLRLLHLFEEADTMTLYSMPQNIFGSIHVSAVLLQYVKSWLVSSADTTKTVESSVFSHRTRMVSIVQCASAWISDRAQGPEEIDHIWLGTNFKKLLSFFTCVCL